MIISYIKRKISLMKMIKKLKERGYQVNYRNSEVIELSHVEGWTANLDSILDGGCSPFISINRKTLALNNGWLRVFGDSDLGVIVDYLYKKYNVDFDQKLPQEALTFLDDYCAGSYFEIGTTQKPSLKSLCSGQLEYVSLSELRSIGFNSNGLNIEGIVADSIKEKDMKKALTLYNSNYKCRIEITIDLFTGKVFELRTMPRLSMSGFFRPEVKYKNRNYRCLCRINEILVSKNVGQMYFSYLNEGEHENYLTYQSNLDNHAD
jgi:hypothetical protein